MLRTLPENFKTSAQIFGGALPRGSNIVLDPATSTNSPSILGRFEAAGAGTKRNQLSSTCQQKVNIRKVKIIILGDKHVKVGIWRIDKKNCLILSTFFYHLLTISSRRHSFFIYLSFPFKYFPNHWIVLFSLKRFLNNFYTF